MSKALIKDTAEALRVAINGSFGDREPWQIAAITTTSVLSAVWFWNVLWNQDESLYHRVKKRVFKLTRKIPMVQAKIDEELGKLKKDFENDMVKSLGQLGYTTKLPFDGKKIDELLQKVDEHLAMSNYNFKGGRVSGALYTVNAEIVELVKEVYGKASYTNPLHSDIFPGVCKMEAEVVRMTATLFHGGPDACGSVSICHSRISNIQSILILFVDDNWWYGIHLNGSQSISRLRT